MNRAREIFLILVLILQHLLCFGQSGPFLSEKSLNNNLPFSIQNWNSENGLPQNSVTGITQSIDGYLWISTNNGLVRFDGVNFKLFNSLNVPVLKSNIIRQLFSDSKGRVWFINSRTTGKNLIFNIVVYVNGQFKSCSSPFGESKVFMTESAAGRVVMGGGSRGIFEVVNDSLIKLAGLSKVKITAMKFVGEELYIGTDKGLYQKSDELALIGDSLEPIHFLAEGLNDTLWVGKRRSVCKFFQGSFITDSITRVITGMKAVEIQQLSDGKILVHGGNRFMVYEEGKIFEFNVDNGLSGKTLNCFYPDTEGNIWIGTSINGLNKLKRHTFNANINEHLYRKPVRSIYQMRDSCIWIGFKGGEIQCIDKNNVLHNFPTHGKSGIYSILEDKRGNKWIGTYGNGIIIYKANGDTVKLRSAGIFKPAIIRALFEDSKGVIWIGAEDGIHQFENEEFTKLEGVGYENVSFIMEDSKGVIYYGSFDGIGVIAGKHHYTFPGLDKRMVRSIYEDKQKVLWVGTYGSGLSRCKDGHCFDFGVQNGMLNHNVSSIVEDAYGFLWMSSNQGMYRVEKKSLNNLAEGKSKVLNSRIYLKEDGIHNVEFNGGAQNSACIGNDGSILFPTLSGVVGVKPAVINGQSKPKVLIEGISIDGQDFNVSSDPAINSTNNEIQIRYTIPTFNFPQNVRFQYKLEGKQSDWVNAGSRRTAYFSNLSGGNYVFRVRSYEDPNNEASYSFKVPIPFWNRPWFVICEILLLALIIYLLLRYRIKSIKKREQVKTELNKQFATLELKALQAQMNPHFIFNALNSIQHFYLINDDLQANEYMGKFSSLMRMFLEHSKSTFITLKEETDLLKLYIDLENLQLERPFEINFNLVPDIEADFIKIPGMMFQPFVENAINHGLKHLKAQGKLSVLFEVTEDRLIGIVEDNGIGRQQAKALKVERMQKHISRGMQITDERIKALYFMQKLELKVKIIDKEDKNGIPLGTRVEITIPIKH